MNRYTALYFSFLRLGALTFGGGMAMLPLMQHEVVERHHWSTEEELIDMYAIAQCAPGIIAINSATYVGHHVAGVLGSIAAVLGEITSPMLVITCIAAVFQHFTDVPVFQHALSGMQIGVCALLCHTVWRMGKKSIVDHFTILLGVVSFLMALIFQIPLIVLTLGAGLLGVAFGGKNTK